MEFSRQEYWSGLPFPSPGDLTDPGIKPESPALQADALLSEPPGNPYISSILSSISRPMPETLHRLLHLIKKKIHISISFLTFFFSEIQKEKLLKDDYL